MDKRKTSHLKFDVGSIRRGTVVRLVILGVLSLATAVVVFLAGLFLFPRVVYLASGQPPTNWGSLGDVSNLVTLSLVIGGGVFVFVEYIGNEIQQRRESAETSFNIYKDLFEHLTNPEDTAARRWIILNILPPGKEQDKQAWLEQAKAKLFFKPDAWEGEMPPGQTYLKHVLNTFDFIGFVAGNYWNMEDELVEWMSPPIAKVWERIGPYVEQEAVDRHEPDYYKSAREFGDYCLNWRREHYPAAVIIDKAT